MNKNIGDMTESKLKDFIIELQEKNSRYEKRNEKAIEEIEKYLLTEDYCSLKCEDLADTFHKLLEILKGKSE